eukprot:296418-Rhodomonas_salina.2
MKLPVSLSPHRAGMSGMASAITSAARESMLAELRSSSRNLEAVAKCSCSTPSSPSSLRRSESSRSVGSSAAIAPAPSGPR